MKGTIFWAVCFSGMPLVCLAEKPFPPMPEDLHWVNSFVCVDLTTKEEGYCKVAEDDAGVRYIVFTKNNVIMFIRKIFTDDTYLDLWVADHYASI